VGAATQRLFLGADVAPPDGQHHLDTVRLSQRAQDVTHLIDKFTGGHQHQGLNGPHLGIDILDQRQPEGQSFSRARTGLADHISALHERGNGQLLNRGRVLNPHFAEHFQAAGQQTEVGKQGLLS